MKFAATPAYWVGVAVYIKKIIILWKSTMIM